MLDGSIIAIIGTLTLSSFMLAYINTKIKKKQNQKRYNRSIYRSLNKGYSFID